MSAAAPPPWVRKLSIPSGAWRCLVGLWGFARYVEAGPARVWPSRSTLAEATGQTPHAVAKQLRQLLDLGWIRRPNVQGSTVFELAWAAPFAGDGVQDGPGPVQTGPDTDGSAPDTVGSDPDTERSVVRIQDGPQTSKERCKDLPRNVAADARPSGKPANVELPDHAAKALAKAKRTPPPAMGSKLSPELCRAIGETSQAAALALANSNSHQWAWAPMLHERMLSEAWTDAEPIAVLAVWESTPRADKPAMGELWQRKHAGWCREALGDDAWLSSKRVQSAPPSSGYDFTSDDIKADLEAGRI